MSVPHVKALVTSMLWRCPHLTPRAIKLSQAAVFVDAVNLFNGGVRSDKHRLNRMLNPKLLRFLHERGGHPGLPQLRSCRGPDGSALMLSADVDVQVLETQILLDENEAEDQLVRERLRILVKDPSQLQDWSHLGEELPKHGESDVSALNIRVRCQFAFGVEPHPWYKSFSSSVVPVHTANTVFHEEQRQKYEWTCVSAEPVFKCRRDFKLRPRTDVSTSVEKALDQIWQNERGQLDWIVEDMKQII